MERLGAGIATCDRRRSLRVVSTIAKLGTGRLWICFPRKLIDHLDPWNVSVVVHVRLRLSVNRFGEQCASDM